MNPDPMSLERLHDLVLPPPVPWWPPAPGWYVVLALLVLSFAWLTRRSWKAWRAKAYRRAALRELATLEDVAAIAELLRRTVLAVLPRPLIAGMTGDVWTDWLAAQCPEAMSPEVRRMLTAGVYGPPAADHHVSALRDYAARWIRGHHLISPDGRRIG